MVDVVERTMGGSLHRAVLNGRELTVSEYEKLTDDQLAFLLGVDVESIDVDEFRIEIEGIFYRQPERVVSEGDRGKDIREQIVKLQADYEKELKPR